MLHGGVCHRTSTPHKSGNDMKRKKKLDIDTSTSDYDIKGEIKIAHKTDPMVYVTCQKWVSYGNG